MKRKHFKQFINIMNNLGEPVFGTPRQLRKQVNTVFNYQGYWSGIRYRVFFDGNKFEVKERWE